MMFGQSSYATAALANHVQPFQQQAQYYGGLSNYQPTQYEQQYYQAAPSSQPNGMSVTLSWIISVFAPEKRNIFTKIKNVVSRHDVQNDATTIRILNNVSGIVKPGQLCAIMGSSGAGKTTLLNVLNFRNRGKLIVDGDIRVNGKAVSLNEISQYSGYVQQTDLFIGTMTVREHLTFLAFLRMGRNFTTEEKNARVDEIIQQVNLFKAQDTPIGVVDQVKGISGGEKRRLAFASERHKQLICMFNSHARKVFCDEPTSGLDAFMAVGLVDIMREQARQGKTIVCTIHQPSSQIFESFDTLCLLSEGRVAYFGPSKDAVDFFSRMGYVCPQNYNPADFYIQTLSILPTSREQSIARTKAICDVFESSQQQTNIFNSISLEHQNISYDNSSDFKTRYAATFVEQFRWLFWRSFINDSRTPIATKLLLIQTFIIAIFFGLIYLQLYLDEIGMQNTNGLLFILMMNNGFIFLFPILNTFTPEMPIFFREHKNRVYSTAIYYITKQISELPKYVLFSFILVTIIYWMANIRADVTVFFAVAFTMVLSAQTGAGFAYMLSVLSENVDVGSALAGPIIIPLILFSGYFLANSSTPVYFIWIKYISWFYYTYEALQIEVWDGVKSIKCTTPIVDGCANSQCYSNGQAVLNSYGVESSNLARDLILIAVIGLVFRIAGYIILKLKSRR